VGWKEKGRVGAVSDEDRKPICRINWRGRPIAQESDMTAEVERRLKMYSGSRRGQGNNWDA